MPEAEPMIKRLWRRLRFQFYWCLTPARLRRLGDDAIDDYIESHGLLTREGTTCYMNSALWVRPMLNDRALRMYGRSWTFSQIPSGSMAFLHLPAVLSILGEHMPEEKRIALVDYMISRGRQVNWTVDLAKLIERYDPATRFEPQQVGVGRLNL